MRILSVTAQKADSTGSGVFLTELVKGFQKAGHQQAVICGVTKEDTIRLPEGVDVFPMYYKSDEVPFPVCGMSDEMPYESTRYCDMTETMTEQLFCAFRSKIREAVESFHPDVVLCHHLYFLTALLREMYPQLPVYGQCHGSDLRQYRKNPWQHELIQPQIQKLNGIFALHEQQKIAICETYNVPEEMVTVMGTGYNSDLFFNDEAVKAQKNSDKLRLIFAGKISEKKGVMSLLRALHHVKQPVELALAGGYGNEAEYAEIRRLAEEAPCEVNFLGRLNHQQLAQELNRSDIFVLPSFYEGLPLVLIEAMACGLRVICSDLPGIQPWMERAIPNSGVVFVEPPQMQNEDEALPESLPAFERRLADAIEAVQKQPLAEQKLVRAVSWDALCGKLCEIWQ